MVHPDLSISTHEPDVPIIWSPESPMLRPYQIQAIEATYEAERCGINRALIELPTGTGKTLVLSQVLLQRKADRSGRIIMLVHRYELMQQTIKTMRSVCPDLAVGVIQGARNDVNADIIVASVQTLSRPERLQHLASDFVAVGVDEAHHASAVSFQRILNHLGSFRTDGPLTVGITATPERSDGTSWKRVWQQIVYRRDMLDMMEDGYLVDLRAERIVLKADFTTLRKRAGEFIPEEVERLLRRTDAPRHIVNAYQSRAAGRKTLVFASSVKQAHKTAAAFQQAGVLAEAVDGSMCIPERQALYTRWRNGETRVVVNVNVMTEGFDEPSIECIIIAQPTTSRPRYIQMIGRGTRPSPDKSECLILDLVGVTERHDLMTAATAFGVDAAALEHRTVRAAVRQQRLQEHQRQEPQGRLVATPVDLFGPARLHWARENDSLSVLALGDVHLAVVTSKLDATRGTVLEVSKSCVNIVEDNLPLHAARELAETLARKRGKTGLVQRDAHWRRNPISKRQISMMTRSKISYSPTMTTGAASDLISLSVVKGLLP